MAVGGAAGGWRGVAMGSYIGGLLPTVLKFVVPNQGFSWERVQENEADDYGMKLMFERNYDPKEVPQFYARLQRMNTREPRVGEGFIARPEQVAERVKQVSGLASAFTANPALALGAVNLRELRPADGADGRKKFSGRQQAVQGARASLKRLEGLEARLKEKLEKGEIQGTSEEFGSVMADLKRDNGVRAFYYDMFQLAIDNLSESLQIRSNDPYTHFYYGKVLQQTARTSADKANAMLAFQEAINMDERGTLPGPWLHRALMIIAERNVNQNAEAVQSLQRYVEVYQQISGGALPPNISTVYAYMKDLGNNSWVARPAMNVSTKNIAPLEITSDVGRQPVPAPQPVVQPRVETPVKKRN
jgi:predicted Zn-dependent protease